MGHRVRSQKSEERRKGFFCGSGFPAAILRVFFSKCPFQCCNVDLTGEVDRTLTMYWIPARGICRTEVLCLQANTYLCLFYGQSLYPLGSVPGCSARCTSAYLDAVNFAVRYLHSKLRRAKIFTILTQADLPGKAASSWRGQSPFYPKFLP